MALPATLSVAAIIKLDGDMVGLAFAGPDGPMVLSSTEMLGLVARLQAAPACRAVEVTDLDARVRELLRLDTGVPIERVRAEPPPRRRPPPRYSSSSR